MPKYLALCKYSAEGFRGLLKEKAVPREQYIRSLYEANGAKVESLYWVTTGEYTVAMIVECTREFGVAMTTTVLATGGISEIKTFELMSMSEIDSALSAQIVYRAPSVN